MITAPRANPISTRSRRFTVGMLATLPGAVEPELLTPLSLGYGGSELDVIEPGRGLEGRDEGTGGAGLADQLDALGVHVQSLEPCVLGDERGEVTQERQGAQPLGLDALDGGHQLLLPARQSREPFHRLRLGVEALDLLRDLSHVALAL